MREIIAVLKAEENTRIQNLSLYVLMDARRVRESAEGGGFRGRSNKRR